MEKEIAKLVSRIQKYGPRPTDVLYCTPEHIRDRYPDGEFGKCETLEDVVGVYLRGNEYQQEALLPFLVSLEDEALDIFRNRSRRYAGGDTFEHWPGLKFSEEGGGKARLSNIAGWLTGLAMGGPDMQKLAGRLALDLHKQFQYLAGYGGKHEIERDSGLGTLSVSRYKVVLGDDGTLHGFTVTWFQCVTNKRRLAQAEAVRAAKTSPVEDLARSIDEKYADGIWSECILEAEGQLGLRENLKDWIHYYPVYDSGKGASMCSDSVHYGRSFNGGLLYRGPGSGEIFSVNLDPRSGKDSFWSVHT